MLVSSLTRVVRQVYACSLPAMLLNQDAEARSKLGIATKLCHPMGKGVGDPFNASSPVSMLLSLP